MEISVFIKFIVMALNKIGQKNLAVKFFSDCHKLWLFISVNNSEKSTRSDIRRYFDFMLFFFEYKEVVNVLSYTALCHFLLQQMFASPCIVTCTRFYNSLLEHMSFKHFSFSYTVTSLILRRQNMHVVLIAEIICNKPGTVQK